MKRTPLTRKTPLQRGAPLRRGGRLPARSSRRDARDALYDERRQQARARAKGRCEARFVDGCAGTTDQIHHIAGRGGPDPHRLDNLLACCKVCHPAIHAEPARARKAGLMKSRLGQVR